MTDVPGLFFVAKLGDDAAEQMLRDDLEKLGLTLQKPELGGLDPDFVNILYLSMGVLARDVATGLVTDLVKAAMAKTASWVRREKKAGSKPTDYAAEIHLYHAETGEYLGRAHAVFSVDDSIQIITDNDNEPELEH